jgi:hypothetical protein
MANARINIATASTVVPAGTTIYSTNKNAVSNAVAAAKKIGAANGAIIQTVSNGSEPPINQSSASSSLLKNVSTGFSYLGA